MKSKIFLLLGLIFSTVSTTSAACTFGFCLENIGKFINDTNQLVVVSAGMLLLAVTVVGFFLGVVRFIWAQQQGDQKGIDNGKKLLLWGVIALTCAFSIYGIIFFLQSTLLGSGDHSKIVVPRLIIDTPTTSAGSGNVQIGPSGAQDKIQIGPSGAQSNNISSDVLQRLGITSNESAGAGRGGSLGACTDSSGMQGSFVNGKCIISKETTATQAYQSCMENGNSGTECQGVYDAYMK